MCISLSFIIYFYDKLNVTKVYYVPGEKRIVRGNKLISYLFMKNTCLYRPHCVISFDHEFPIMAVLVQICNFLESFCKSLEYNW